MTAERNVCQDLTLEALHRAVPRETIPAVLLQTETQVPRVRALTAQLPIGVLIAMNLSTPRALGHVLRKVAYGLRFSWPDPPYRVPGASACVYRGSHRGAPPLVVLDERLAHLLVTPQTPGAFRFGVRLLAIEGTVIAAAARLLQFGRRDLARLATQLMEVEAEHRALDRVIASVRPPNDLTLQPAPFACLSARDALLRPYGPLRSLRPRCHGGHRAAERWRRQAGDRYVRDAPPAPLLVGKGSTMTTSPPRPASDWALPARSPRICGYWTTSRQPLSAPAWSPSGALGTSAGSTWPSLP